MAQRLRLVAFVCGYFLSATAGVAGLRYEKLMTEDGVPFLVVAGDFTFEDGIADFVAAATSHNAVFVTFDSAGGSIYSAIQHGRMIRSLKLNTIQTRSFDCSSACALAFVGGVNRAALPGSIGVHQHSFAPELDLGRDDAVAAAQLITADVLDYLSEMGVDAGLMQLALRYDATDMRYLSGGEMVSLGVTNADAPGAATAVSVTQPENMPEKIPLPSPAPRESAAQVSSPPRPVDAKIAKFVGSLIESHSKDDTLAIRDVIVTYASSISYFGKQTRLRDVVADKRSYFRRWPERKYAVRWPSLLVSCNSYLCDVSGIMDWTVRNVPRNRQAAGAASFRYQVAVTNGMKIVLEESAVLSE